MTSEGVRTKFAGSFCLFPARPPTNGPTRRHRFSGPTGSEVMVEPFYKELGKNLIEWRKKRGLTQEEVGKLLSPPLKKATIARMEAGLQRVLSHSLAQLANVLGVDEHDLIPGRGSRRLSEARWQERTATRLRSIHGAAVDTPSSKSVTETEGKERRRQLEMELAEKLGLSPTKARNLAGKLTRKRSVSEKASKSPQKKFDTGLPGRGRKGW